MNILECECERSCMSVCHQVCRWWFFFMCTGVNFPLKLCNELFLPERIQKTMPRSIYCIMSLIYWDCINTFSLWHLHLHIRVSKASSCLLKIQGCEILRRVFNSSQLFESKQLWNVITQNFTNTLTHKRSDRIKQAVGDLEKCGRRKRSRICVQWVAVLVRRVCVVRLSDWISVERQEEETWSHHVLQQNIKRCRREQIQVLASEIPDSFAKNNNNNKKTSFYCWICLNAICSNWITYLSIQIL